MLGERRGLTLYLLAIDPSILLLALAGLLGGLAVFVYAINNNRYQNNKIFLKSLTESVGGLIIATLFMTIFFGSYEPSLLLVAFAIGLMWGIAAQIIRSAITRHVVQFLEEE